MKDPERMELYGQQVANILNAADRLQNDGELKRLAKPADGLRILLEWSGVKEEGEKKRAETRSKAKSE